MARVFEGQLSAAGLRFAIIVSRFNSFITERLLAGAMDALHRSGALEVELGESGGRDGQLNTPAGVVALSLTLMISTRSIATPGANS